MRNMRKLILVIGLLFFLSNSSFCQTIDNTKLYGKWITCKMIDSTDFGAINLENVDSFTTSIRLISKKKDFLKKIKLDTIANEEERYIRLKTFLTPFYNLFHGTWIEFHTDSTATQYMRGENNDFINYTRTFELNIKTNHLILGKKTHPEELLLKVLSEDTMILSFYSEDINLLVRRAD